MSKVIERVEAREVPRIEDAHYTCAECGCGATVGSPASEGYVEGEACPTHFCEDGIVELVPEHTYMVRVPGYVLVECDCHRYVYCEGFTSTCAGCGADYNWNGDRLAPRHMWGEETGEHPADIVNNYDPEEVF